LRLDRSQNRLVFGYHAGRTRLVGAHTELPLLVQRPLHGPAGEAVVTLLTPSGALFDGDSVSLEVVCGPSTDVTLTSASATKLNRCEQGVIGFDLHADVAAGATFRYLPHELIAFGGTRYRQRITLDLWSDARAWLLEVVATSFAFDALTFETSIRHAATLAARERFSMTSSSISQLGGHTHYAGLFLLGPDLSRETAAEVGACVGQHAVGGASLLPSRGLVAKALGDAAEPLRRLLLAAARVPDWLVALLPP
jgi:urease accessory protein UreH